MRFSAVPLAQTQAGRADTSLSNSKHAWNEKILHERPRMLWFGPRGRIDQSQEEFDPWGGHIRWPYADGDGGEVELETVSMQLHHVGSDVEIRGFFLAVHCVTSLGFSQTYEQLQAGCATGNWTVKFSAVQLADGDANWAAATELDSVSSTMAIPHWPTDSSGAWMALQQQFWARFGYDGRRYGLTYREGQLRTDDFGFVHPFILRLSTDGATDDPIRFKLTAELNSAQYRTPSNKSTQYLRLSLVGSSAWEYAQ